MTIKGSMYLDIIPDLYLSTGLFLSDCSKFFFQGCKLNWISDRGVVNRRFQPLSMVQLSSHLVAGF